MPQLIAKKHLGQHFLKDKDIARKIVSALHQNTRTVIEVGPGTGILTSLLVQQKGLKLYLVEIDARLVADLQKRYPSLCERIMEANFLQVDLSKLFPGTVAIIGNFPYNISSQLFFKVLTHRQQVTEVVGMVQREVALRLVASPGNKIYGLLSVLLQAFYDLDYLFTVAPQVFTPPPKVWSAVVRLRRNNAVRLQCNEDLFFKVVKASFAQRRKTLRNALSALLPSGKPPLQLLTKRAEQLTVADFVALTNYIQHQGQVL